MASIVDLTLEESEGQTFLQNENVDDFCKKIMTVVRSCQQHSTDLQGWQHYSDFAGVQFTMARINKLLHNLISKVFIHQDIKLDINGLNLSDQLDIIKEGNDALCERVNSDLDEASGARRNHDMELIDSTVRVIRGPVNRQAGQEVVLVAARNVQKPQVFFSPKINNSEKEPFIPLIKEKPNSLKPLAVMICLDMDGNDYYSHPYEYELQHWSPPEELLVKRDPVAPLPMEDTPFAFVDTEQTLYTMVEELKQTKEIAVDLEHHSFRSYQGLTCLIQISTRAKDYIVDPFPIRNQLPVLNEVFTDPKITKIFHGADHDILWLQRDCGVYVVNMFDTHQAAIVLQFPHRSLANLLLTFCHVTANKTYQRSDWRIRPLPEEFITYARQDSHYLLYIFDLMRNQLIERGNQLNNLLIATYDKSTEICLRRYEKPRVGPDSHMELYRRSRKSFDARQLFALQQLYLWRDRIARQQDESADYVLPKHMLLQISEVLPKEMQGILACCNPIPSLVKTEQLSIHQILREARELPIEKISSDLEQSQSFGHCVLAHMQDMRDHKNALLTRHDLSFVEDDPKGLGTLLNPQETILGDLFDPKTTELQKKIKSALYGVVMDGICCCRAHLNCVTEQFMSPFERYKLFLQNKDKFEEEQRPSLQQTTSDEARIKNIKEHFLSLMQTPTSDSNKVNESNSDQKRLERLQEHIASLVSMPGSSSSPCKKKKRKDKKGKPKTQQKRKSSEPALEEGMQKRIKAEGEQEREENEEGEIEGEERVEAFDYAKVNYSIFKPQKIKKRGRTIQQGFIKKGQLKSRSEKSGVKSMSWGLTPNN